MPPKRKKQVPVKKALTYADEMRARSNLAIKQEIDDAMTLAATAVDETVLEDIVEETKRVTAEQADRGEFNAYVSVHLPLWEGAGTARMQRLAHQHMQDAVIEAVESNTGLTIGSHLGVSGVVLGQSATGTYSISFTVGWKDEE